MKRVLIIGCGNPLRGDDGLGWVASDCLEAVLNDSSVAIIKTQQLTPELAEPASQVDLVIIIDASHAGRPGSWKRAEIEASKNGTGKLGHHFTPAGLLAYVAALYKRTPRMLLVSVAGASFDCMETLSPTVESVLPEVVRHICEQTSRVS
ncbi:MAG: hydrogenase maturation protease [Verrucomicrobiota bacterium]